MRNKEWAEEMAKNLNLGHKVIVHNWRHWTTSKSFSYKHETEKILQEVGEGKFNIIAKSVGSRVALRLMNQVGGRINKAILTGIASTGENMGKVMQKVLSGFPSENLLVIQNANDPFANTPLKATQLLAGMKRARRVKLVRRSRNTADFSQQ